MNMEKIHSELQRLLSIMETLRSPEGCPWDRKQTLDSLKPYIIEESYEVVEALQERDYSLLKEELGDVLLQVVFQSEIAKEEGFFDLIDVLQTLNNKLIRRHPHVFAGKNANTPEEVSLIWQEIKQLEKEGKAEKDSILDDLSTAQPALNQAEDIQKIAAGVGFDWDNIQDVLKKVQEEIDEVEEAINNDDYEEAASETGDLFFAVVNLARFLGVKSEIALLKAILKFKKRFSYIEENVKKHGKEMEQMSLEELDGFWENAKIEIE